MFKDLVHCNNCRWTHFSVSLEYVKNWESEWKSHCTTWSEKVLENFGIKDRVPPSAKSAYGECSRCGGSYRNFSDGSTLITQGSTISPILDRDEDL